MGVTTVTQEYPIPRVTLPTERRQPKTISEGIKSMDIVQGQWHTPGSIMKVTYSDGGYEKYKIVACEPDPKYFKNTLIEGGVVGNKVESVDVEMRFEDGSMKITSTYHTKGDLKLTEEEINTEQNKAKLICQSVANVIQAMAN